MLTGRATDGLLQRPFANYYGLAFVLYELSTPFLNFHWFLDKFGMTGSLAQLINGIALIISFGGCRLVWGIYQSVLIYSDIWHAMEVRDSVKSGKIDLAKNSLETVAEVQSLPLALAAVYLVGNTLLIFLNCYWFGKMIEALVKRFKKPEGKENKKEH